MLRIGCGRGRRQIKEAISISYLRGQHVPNWQLKSGQNQARIGGVSILRNIQYLDSASKLKVKGLVSGLIRIYNATNQKVKYNNLLNKIEKIGWIERDNKTIKNLEVEIEPSILYIQPLNKENEETIISFDDIIKALSDSNDAMTNRFIESLEKWKSDTNKE